MRREHITALIALAMLAAAVAQAFAAPSPRSDKARREFRAANPCPATGQTKGACPGWEIDHIKPLCAGGADAPHNMQWLSVAGHKNKTRANHAFCRAQRKERK